MLQNEIFVILKINEEPFLFSIDPFLLVMKSHLLTFTSKNPNFNISDYQSYKIFISENQIELNKMKEVYNTYDVSMLASEVLLKKQYSSGGVFINTFKSK